VREQQEKQRTEILKETQARAARNAVEGARRQLRAFDERQAFEERQLREKLSSQRSSMTRQAPEQPEEELTQEARRRQGPGQPEEEVAQEPSTEHAPEQPEEGPEQPEEECMAEPEDEPMCEEDSNPNAGRVQPQQPLQERGLGLGAEQRSPPKARAAGAREAAQVLFPTLDVD